MAPTTHHVTFWLGPGISTSSEPNQPSTAPPYLWNARSLPLSPLQCHQAHQTLAPIQNHSLERSLWRWMTLILQALELTLGQQDLHVTDTNTPGQFQARMPAEMSLDVWVQQVTNIVIGHLMSGCSLFVKRAKCLCVFQVCVLSF